MSNATSRVHAMRCCQRRLREIRTAARVVVPSESKDRTRQRRHIASSPMLSPTQNLQRGDAMGPLSPCSPLKLPRVAQDSILTMIGSYTPLVGFLYGLHPSQCPSNGARHVLGYHQVLLRKIPILFPPQHMYFWLDELLQRAWGCD